MEFVLELELIELVDIVQVQVRDLVLVEIAEDLLDFLDFLLLLIEVVLLDDVVCVEHADLAQLIGLILVRLYYFFLQLMNRPIPILEVI